MYFPNVFWTSLSICMCITFGLTAAARQIANSRVLSETLVILSDSFAADFYTISARQLSNRRGNFKVCSKEREEPKPNVFRCSNHRALIEVTDLQTVCKQAVFST